MKYHSRVVEVYNRAGVADLSSGLNKRIQILKIKLRVINTYCLPRVKRNSLNSLGYQI